MPIEIRWLDHGLIKQFSGHLSTEMLLETIGSNLADPRFDSAEYGIFDFTEVTSHDLTTRAIEEAAAFDQLPSEINPRMKVALVVTDPVLTAFAEQYANSDVHHFRTRVFKSIDLAKVWLGLPLDNPV